MYQSQCTSIFFYLYQSQCTIFLSFCHYAFRTFWFSIKMFWRHNGRMMRYDTICPCPSITLLVRRQTAASRFAWCVRQRTCGICSGALSAIHSYSLSAILSPLSDTLLHSFSDTLASQLSIHSFSDTLASQRYTRSGRMEHRLMKRCSPFKCIQDSKRDGGLYERLGGIGRAVGAARCMAVYRQL